LNPYREFSVHVRCTNCVRPATRKVVVPRVEDAPSTVSEFMDSALLANLVFCCSQCEGTAAALVAVTMEGEEVELEEVELPCLSDVA
jgi:hypothetical protein